MKLPLAAAALLLALVPALLLALGPARLLAQSADSPVDTVKAMYAEGSKDVESKLYSKRLNALYAAADRNSKKLNQPVSGMDFDPTTDGQDTEDNYKKTLRYTLSASTDIVAQVRVTLKNFKRVELIYSLVKEDGAWKVDDIRMLNARDGWRLSTLLKAGAAEK